MTEKAKREKHPGKRTFQAIRIEVNRELEILPRAFTDAINMLRINGLIAIITFHSLEDRIAKRILKKESTVDVPRGLPVIPDEFKPILNMVSKKPVMASEAELGDNKRSHSARLRVAVKMIDKNIVLK